MPELMKGKVWAEHKHKLVYPVIAEVKYDEIRLHVKCAERRPGNAPVVDFLSYAGKPIANLCDFYWAFRRFFAENPDITELDMGLLVNGNFNDSYRWARSTSKVPEGLDASMVQFMLFDVPDYGHLPFESDEDPALRLDRRAVRRDTLDALREVGLPVRTPDGMTLESEAMVHAYFDVQRRAGYEGLMVKSREHKYLKGKRIDGWLKMKPEAEADGIIEGFTEAVAQDDVYDDNGNLLYAKGHRHGRAGSVSVRCEDGSTAAPHGIAHDLGKDMWENPEKYIGQWCMFNYMERDRQDGYRHPTWGRLREAKA